MKNIHIARVALILALSAGSAFAADLPSRKGPPPAYVPPPLMWTGFYVGMNSGYAWDAGSSVSSAGYGIANDFDRAFPTLDHITPSALSATGVASAKDSGFIGGAQAGYNYQWGSNFVVGMEADIQGAGIRGRGSFGGVGVASFRTISGRTSSDNVLSAVDHEKTVDWLGTVRGRIGYLATPNLLAYATGGLAYGGVTADTNIAQGWNGRFIGSVFQTSGAVGVYSDARVGWTVGGGLEWMFAPNWSVKGEYLYYDLGSAQWTSGPATALFSFVAPTPLLNAIAIRSQTQFNGHIARLGLNYHFAWGSVPGQSSPSAAADLPNKKGPPVYVAPLWTGLYAGLNAGYSWDASTNVQTVGYGVSNALDITLDRQALAPAALSATGAASANGHGYVGGAQAGYNLRLSNFVAGFETDIQGAGVRGRGSFTGAGMSSLPALGSELTMIAASGVVHRKTVDWLGTVRGRIGYLATPNLLAYATGGLAYGGVAATTHIGQAWMGSDLLSATLQSTGGVGNFSDTRVGWTVGGGLEWMFMPNWSVKGEYLYYDLGSVTWNSGPVGTFFNFNPNFSAANFVVPQSQTRFDGHIARAGVNYHFDLGAPGGVNF